MARPARPHWTDPEPAADPDPQPRPTGEPCAGRCNSRYRAAVRDYDKALADWTARGHTGARPVWPQIEPWPGDPVYCPRCAAVIRGALRELPLAYRALASVKFLTRTASADEERRGRSDVPPSPSPGADHADEIQRVIAGWEDAARQHLRHVAATDVFGDPAATLAASVEYLNANYPELISSEFAADFGGEISRLHSTAVALVKNKPVRRHLPAPCPSCDMAALIQEEGLACKPWYVECSERLGGCGRLFSETDWEWFARLLTGGHVRKTVAA